MLRTDLAKRFTLFVERTRGLMAASDLERRTEEKALEKEYRQLQGLFAQLNDRDTRACLEGVHDEGARAVMDYLVFGREQVRRLQQPIARLIEQDPARTDWAVSAFMTTHAAFMMIQNGRKKDSEAEDVDLDERSRRLLAGMLGVEGYELSGEFAKKVRGELLAATLAYAHSRLCKRDVAAWGSDAELRERYEGNLETYLCDCITRANVPLSYASRERDDGGLDLACAFQEHGEAPPSAASLKDGLGNTAMKLYADAFCVNHEEKLFVVGAATTNSSFDAKQMEAMVRHVKALELLAENDPRYKGYQVRPFFFHTGYFSTSLEGEGGTGQAFVKEARAEGLPQDQLEALAQMAFFNLLAEKHPSPEAGRIFALINPHVAGCPTLTLYEHSEAARRQGRHGRQAAQAVLQGLVRAVEALAADGFDVRKSGPRETLIHGVYHAVNNFYAFYPLEPGHELPAKEAKALLRIGTAMETLCKKIARANSFAGAGALLVPLVALLRNPDSLGWYAHNVGEMGRNKGAYAWSKDLYGSLTKRKGVDILDADYLRDHSANFLASLRDGDVPPLLARVTAYLETHPSVVMGPQSQNMWNLACAELQGLADAARKGHRLNPLDVDGGMKNNASFVQSFRNAAAAETQAGNAFLAATFRMLGALFQMDHRELAGETRSEALRRNAPAFLEACLESQDDDLRVLALATLEGTPNVTLPTRKARGMGR